MGKKTHQKEEKLYKLHLNAAQIEHVRDLLSVVINPSTNATVSEHLAKFNKRSADERNLWDAIVQLCEKAKLTSGDTAPDYVIAVAPPEVGILKIDPEEAAKEQPAEQKNERRIFSIDED